MKVETAETVLSKLVSALGKLDATQFDDSTNPWQNVASIFDTLSLLPKSVNPPRISKPLKDLADRFIQDDPQTPLFYLSQFANGFSMPNFKYAEGLAYITTKWRGSSERENHLSVAVQLLEAHARMPEPDTAAVTEIFTWMLTNGDVEVCSYLHEA
jgi:hypothetical protein